MFTSEDIGLAGGGDEYVTPVTAILDGGHLICHGSWQGVDLMMITRHLQPLQDHRAVHLIVMVNSFIIVIFSGSARPFLFDDGLRVLPGSERVFIIR